MRILAVLLLAGAGVGCGEGVDRAGGPERIYDAVLAHLTETRFEGPDWPLPPDAQPPEVLRIVIAPISKGPVEDWGTRLGGVRQEATGSWGDDTLADYERSNTFTRDISGLLRSVVPITFLADSEFPAAATLEDAWREFYGRFPGAQGYASLSLPGVSTDGREAVVWVSNGQGPLDGWSGFCLLRREAGRWRVVDVLVCEVW